MSSGTSTTSLIAIGVASFALGWLGCMAYNGVFVTAKDANTESQSHVEQNIEGIRKTTTADSKAAEAEGLAAKVIASIKADKDCPDGLGPVSPHYEQRLRDLAERRKDSREEQRKSEGGLP